MSNPTVIVHLRIFKGSEIVKGEDGKVKNQNQTLKLKYDTKEYYYFIGTMYRNGWGRVNVLAVKIDEGGQTDWSKYKDADSELFEKIKTEVQSKLKKISDKPLTQEQKELKELRALVEELTAGGNDTPDKNEELEAARKEYFDLTGEKPHHMKQLKGINEDIAQYIKDNK